MIAAFRMATEVVRMSRVEAERIVAILDDTIEKLGFLDRSHFDNVERVGAYKIGSWMTLSTFYQYYSRSSTTPRRALKVYWR